MYDPILVVRSNKTTPYLDQLIEQASAFADLSRAQLMSNPGYGVYRHLSGFKAMSGCDQNEK